jgi:hypothetical protein
VKSGEVQLHANALENVKRRLRHAQRTVDSLHMLSVDWRLGVVQFLSLLGGLLHPGELHVFLHAVPPLAEVLIDALATAPLEEGVG